MILVERTAAGVAVMASLAGLVAGADSVSNVVNAPMQMPMAAGGGSISIPGNFQIASVDNKTMPSAGPQQAPPPARSIVFDAFVGAYTGSGFNTIFRPENDGTFHASFGSVVGPADNVLQLNLINETLAFTPGPGLTSVPNRGSDHQSDITLAGVAYVQTVDDRLNNETGKADGKPVGIHFEPGLWMVVPKIDTNPVEGQTLNRMGSIPHGTVINAQGFEPSGSAPGPPVIGNTSIVPFQIDSPNSTLVGVFPNLDVSNGNTRRIPQDLTKFNKTGTITQAMLDDPNVVLRNHLRGQKVIDTTTFVIRTQATAALPGGGTANQAFLVGGSAGGNNALAESLTAVFWVETVQWTVTVPAGKAGQRFEALKPLAPNPDVQLPSFNVTLTKDSAHPVNVTARSRQIQYSQRVILNFAGLSWPHVSVNTLAPVTPIVIQV